MNEWLKNAPQSHRPTPRQTGAVWAVVVLVHLFAVFITLWITVPEIEPVSVKPLQIQWIEPTPMPVDNSQSAPTPPPPPPKNEPLVDTPTPKEVPVTTYTPPPPSSEPVPKMAELPPPTQSAIEDEALSGFSTFNDLPKTPLNNPPKTSPQLTEQNDKTELTKKEPTATKPIEPPISTETLSHYENNENAKQTTDNAQLSKNQQNDNDNDEPLLPPKRSEQHKQNTKGKQHHEDNKQNQASQTANADPSDNSNDKSDVDTQALENDWSAKVRLKIEKNLNYPDEALSKKWGGTVILRIGVDKNGNVMAVAVVKGSGKAILDDEAVATARRASPLPPPPTEIMQGQKMQTFVVPVSFDYKKHQ